MFQPGVLDVLEQQLVGPNGGEPLNFKKDIFDPLGDRITLISDFKKPVTEDSQRMLLAVVAGGLQGVPEHAEQADRPGRRPAQEARVPGHDDLRLRGPRHAQPQRDGQRAKRDSLKGPISVAIAKNTLFLSSEPTLLEQVLRGGGPTLADSPAYQAVAKEIPDQVSSMTYVRPDEQARITYDMIKSGQFEKALRAPPSPAAPTLEARQAHRQGVASRDRFRVRPDRQDLHPRGTTACPDPRTPRGHWNRRHPTRPSGETNDDHHHERRSESAVKITYARPSGQP